MFSRKFVSRYDRQPVFFFVWIDLDGRYRSIFGYYPSNQPSISTVILLKCNQTDHWYQPCSPAGAIEPTVNINHDWPTRWLKSTNITYNTYVLTLWSIQPMTPVHSWAEAHCPNASYIANRTLYSEYNTTFDALRLPGWDAVNSARAWRKPSYWRLNPCDFKDPNSSGLTRAWRTDQTFAATQRRAGLNHLSQCLRHWLLARDTQSSGPGTSPSLRPKPTLQEPRHALTETLHISILATHDIPVWERWVARTKHKIKWVPQD